MIFTGLVHTSSSGSVPALPSMSAYFLRTSLEKLLDAVGIPWLSKSCLFTSHRRRRNKNIPLTCFGEESVLAKACGKTFYRTHIPLQRHGPRKTENSRSLRTDQILPHGPVQKNLAKRNKRPQVQFSPKFYSDITHMNYGSRVQHSGLSAFSNLWSCKYGHFRIFFVTSEEALCL
ncbi:uncharacterized protein LOC107401216 isoform X1 [Peromyscus maniculatus bairdii]|uniref:uncharacterized protein LOC107401216 isoform X1 n=1 Tax=Peromyscus maniculatus bairdii TaxID=230844 RepID=UPI003FCF4239